MMDRVEAPSITDGYGLSLAFLAMLDVTRCVQVQPHFIATKRPFNKRKLLLNRSQRNKCDITGFNRGSGGSIRGKKTVVTDGNSGSGSASI